MGHNSGQSAVQRHAPLTPYRYRVTVTSLDRLKVSFEQERPSLATIEAARKVLTETAAKLAAWIGRHANTAADAFAKSFGTTLGPIAAMALARSVPGAQKEILTLVRLLEAWLKGQ